VVKAKKIGISLPPGLYEWAVKEVEQGHSESVSALIAESLDARRAHAELGALVRDLAEEIGELTDEDRARIEEARLAAREARRRHVEGKSDAGHAA
jgi:Arc/MetJ-type ribon-helix-helix transcriptional regulator